MLCPHLGQSGQLTLQCLRLRRWNRYTKLVINSVRDSYFCCFVFHFWLPVVGWIRTFVHTHACMHTRSAQFWSKWESQFFPLKIEIMILTQFLGTPFFREKILTAIHIVLAELSLRGLFSRLTPWTFDLLDDRNFPWCFPGLIIFFLCVCEFSSSCTILRCYHFLAK